MTNRRPRPTIIDPGLPRQREGAAALWVPWLVAPLFAVMPMGGCALADRWRQAVAQAPAAAAPVEAVVTVDRE
jgi:hypothetical protein